MQDSDWAKPKAADFLLLLLLLLLLPSHPHPHYQAAEATTTTTKPTSAAAEIALEPVQTAEAEVAAQEA